MIDIEGIFKNKSVNTDKLIDFGFKLVNGTYEKSYEIMNGQFKMDVSITDLGGASIKVWDLDSEEEYVLIHSKQASGKFVGTVIEECEKNLKLIADNCYQTQIFKSLQAKQVISYAREKYNGELEFLWDKFPDNAILRRADTGKWYAALLSVNADKIGLPSDKRVEVLDLRLMPEKIEELVDGKKYFAGYHMNKKHWFTICLDGSVSIDEIYKRIDESYLLAKK